MHFFRESIEFESQRSNAAINQYPTGHNTFSTSDGMLQASISAKSSVVFVRHGQPGTSMSPTTLGSHARPTLCCCAMHGIEAQRHTQVWRFRKLKRILKRQFGFPWLSRISVIDILHTAYGSLYDGLSVFNTWSNYCSSSSSMGLDISSLGDL